jgi:AraC-like DNA-binding protein
LTACACFATNRRTCTSSSPKAFARVIRFQRAVRLMTSGRAANLTEVAHACGYYDQPHFTRDFRAFAGVTPSTLLKSRFPEHFGFSS